MNRAGDKTKLQEVTKILEQLDAKLAAQLADEIKAAGGADKPSKKNGGKEKNVEPKPDAPPDLKPTPFKPE